MVRGPKAEIGTPRGHRWSWWCLVLVLASACGSSEDVPSPSGSTTPSTGGDLQLRAVTEIVPRSSADWDETPRTCAAEGDAIEDCVASELDAPRIVLLGPGEAGEKYVLGPRIVDGNDVETAIAQQDVQQGRGWSVFVELTAEGTAAFETATEAAVGSKIAIIIDGRIVSSPVVAAPITSGDVVLASGLTERAATSWASKLDPGGT
jgi:preprotein translocase subunit SecD